MAIKKLNKTWKNKGDWSPGNPTWNATTGQEITDTIDSLIDRFDSKNMDLIANDLNNYKEPGVYVASGNSNGTIQNLPKISSSSIILVFKINDVITQIAIASEGKTIYIRRFFNNNWLSWFKFLGTEETIPWIKPMEGLQYRKNGNLAEIYVALSISKNIVNGEWVELHTLPVGYRPLATVALPLILRKEDQTYVIGLAQILNTGVVRISQRTGTNIAINAIWFTATFGISS